jgi:hypothetical protein
LKDQLGFLVTIILGGASFIQIKTKDPEINWGFAARVRQSIPTDISPSAFHREFKNNYLKCHNHRPEYRRTARIRKSCALNASLTASYCRRNYRRTTKNMEGHYKFWCKIENLPMDFWHFTDGII